MLEFRKRELGWGGGIGVETVSVALAGGRVCAGTIDQTSHTIAVDQRRDT